MKNSLNPPHRIPQLPLNWKEQLFPRLGEAFVEARLEEEERIHRGEPVRYFAHELEETRYIFGILTVFLRMCGLYQRGVKNAFNFQMRENEFVIESLPSSFKPFRILQLADVHIDAYPRFGEALAKEVKDLEFDLVIFTGDFCFSTHHESSDLALQALHHLLPALECPYGIYGILGNHDTLSLVPLLEAMGIQMLVNENIQIETPEGAFWLVGVDDPHHFQLVDLEKAFQGLCSKDPLVLLSHSPEIIPEAQERGVDLYLTGHTHGGQFCLPGGYAIFRNARCEREYIRGLWNYKEMPGYTSVGTGSSGIFARYNCLPEITIHTLVAGEKSDGNYRKD